MAVHFQRIAARHAAEIAGWRYPGRYAVYDLDSEGEELLKPDLHYHVWCRDARVCWFLCYGIDARVPGFDYERHGDFLDVGWGLRPDLTGRGMGRKLVSCALEFISTTTGTTSFRVTVAAFNERCLAVCRSVGFSDSARFTRADGNLDFIVLTKDTTGPIPAGS
jgi:RimJ/RimL family protein N-acetyltransferase